MACLDTTVFIDLRGRGEKTRQSDAQHKIDTLRTAGETLALSRFTVAELYVGVHLSTDSRDEAAIVDSMAAQFSILEFTSKAAIQYAIIAATRRPRGRPIGAIDALIAASASVAGHVLVTRNVKDFFAIPGLQVQGY